METTPIKIIIADDHELFRDGLKVMLNKQKNFKLVGEVVNGQLLVERIDALKPNIVITDIKMPEMDGIEATKLITKKHPGIGIIALSMYDDNDLIVEMLEAGAKGYLVKNSNKETIIEAITTVYNGNPYYCKETSSKLAGLIINSKFNPYNNQKKVDFSDRELEIIQLICKQMTSKQIAEKLCLNARTIEGIKSKIEVKMGVNSTVGLVIYALKNGLAAM